MTVNPIIPIWLMTILCVALLLLKRKGIIPYIRQIAIIVLIFVINLRIMVPDGNVKGKTKQVDAYVLFVVDNTISMLARDYNGETERLTAVQEDCAYIIDELYGAKFSVISFDNNANLLSPFTDNADYAKSVVNSIYPMGELYARGSSMNICKDLLIDTLKTAKEKKNGNVIVFFISDGEITNGDSLESFKETADYIDNGAVLGYGTKEGGEMYVQSYFDEKPVVIEDTSTYPYKTAKSKIDENNLEQIADDLGVNYVNMNKRADIDKILKDIKNDSKVSITDTDMTGYADIYYIFVIPLLLLLLYEFIEYRRRV